VLVRSRVIGDFILSIYDPSLHLRESPADRWIFRWVFEFANGTKKTGGWYPASRIEDMASSVNKSGLLYACVEGKHWTTREPKEFVRVPGADFLNFEHLAVLIMQAGGRTINHVYGMRVQTRQDVISCFENGSIKVERRELGPDFIYPEWTRV
jgi:hypothetical protein